MNGLVAGKRAVVTGAAVGIGLEIVRRLAAEGAMVSAADIAMTDDLRAETDATGGIAVECDLGERNGPADFVGAATEAMSGLDILVNNLGASPVRDGFLSVSDDDWQRLFDVNFFSMVRACRAALPHLIEAKGVIVTVASVLAREPAVIQPDYCASKAALLSITKTLSKEFGPMGVRALCVSPGPTLTPQWTVPGGMVDRYAAREGVSPQEALEITIPEALDVDLRRLIRPSEVADAVLFAVGPHATAVTGTEILVDGGMRNSI